MFDNGYGLLTFLFTLGILVLMYKKSGWWFLAFFLWGWTDWTIYAGNWTVPITGLYMSGILLMTYSKSKWWFLALFLWNWTGVFAVIGIF